MTTPLPKGVTPLPYVQPPVGRDIPLIIPVGTQVCRYDAELKRWEVVRTTKEVRYDWDDLCHDPAPTLITPLLAHVYYFALPLDAYPYTTVAVSIAAHDGRFQGVVTILAPITQSLHHPKVGFCGCWTCNILG